MKLRREVTKLPQFTQVIQSTLFLHTGKMAEKSMLQSFVPDEPCTSQCKVLRKKKTHNAKLGSKGKTLPLHSNH